MKTLKKINAEIKQHQESIRHLEETRNKYISSKLSERRSLNSLEFATGDNEKFTVVSHAITLNESGFKDFIVVKLRQNRKKNVDHITVTINNHSAITTYWAGEENLGISRSIKDTNIDKVALQLYDLINNEINELEF